MTVIPYAEDAAAPVEYDDLRATGRIGLTEPQDFDEFWTETLAACEHYQIGVTRQPVATPLSLICVEDLQFRGWEGTPVRAWLLRPAEHAETLPLVVQFCGYGGGRGLPLDHLSWAAAGFAHLVMDTRGQGTDTPDHPVEAISGPDGPHVLRGLGDRHHYYYRRLIADAVRAVAAARTLDCVDPDVTVVAGVSQGGGLALAVAALVPDLTAVLCDIPFMANWSRALTVADRGPYAQVSRALAANPGLAALAHQTLPYFDAVNFAARATAPAFFSVAMRDRVCPPSTVLAAYREYLGPKELTTYPYNDHEGGGTVQQMRQVAAAASAVANGGLGQAGRVKSSILRSRHDGPAG